MTVITQECVSPLQHGEATSTHLCDASPYGIGAVLNHLQNSGHKMPIAYYIQTKILAKELH